MNKQSITFVIWLTLGLAACGGNEHEEPTSSVVAYEGATLITGDGGPPLGGGVLLVDDGVITAVGLAANIDIPNGATVVDLTGKTVMPTLVDLHGHIGFMQDLSFDYANYTRENITDQLNRYAYHGVSTIVSLGTDPGDLAFTIQAEQLFTAFRGIARPNAGPGAATMRQTALGVSTAEEARELVGEIANTRARFVKIWVDDRGGSVDKLTADLYVPIIEEAHARQLQVIAHIFYQEDARDLVAAGVDGFAHLPRDVEMDDALVTAIVENNVFVMPNLSISERGQHSTAPDWLDDPLLLESVSSQLLTRIRTSIENRSPEAASASAASYAAMQQSLRKLAAAGATLVLGADTGVQDHLQGFMEHRELELIVEAGLSPSEAIAIATSVPAAVLGVDTGLLAPGKQADFLVLDANPMYGITNTRQISAVYLQGQVLDREGLRAPW